jgi:hypothetical protein
MAYLQTLRIVMAYIQLTLAKLQSNRAQTITLGKRTGHLRRQKL